MILSGAKLLTDFSAADTDNNSVVFGKGIIRTVGSLSKIKLRYPHDKVINIENAVLLPGLVNLHTHLELPPLLKQIGAKSVPDWVLNLLKAKSGLTTKTYLSAAKKNIQALMESGTSTVAEICTHHVSPAVLRESGLRSVLYNEVISMHPASAAPQFTSFLKNAPLIDTGISPHAPHTVSAKVLLHIKKFANQHDIRLSMHVAESKDEIQLLLGRKSGFGKLYKKAGWDLAWAPRAASPFEYLYKLGLLGPRFLAVHAVHATDRDIALIKKTRTPIAHCPRSNKELGVGRMPLKKFLDAGVTVGLGTDSLASCPSLNMWDEMRYAYKIHKKDGVTAEDILKMATIGGAKALGMDKTIGSLEVGKRADIVVVPLPSKNTGDIYSDLLRETNSCIMTIVNGRILYRRR